MDLEPLLRAHPAVRSVELIGWDWALWLEQKHRRGLADLVAEELLKMHGLQQEVEPALGR